MAVIINPNEVRVDNDSLGMLIIDVGLLIKYNALKNHVNVILLLLCVFVFQTRLTIGVVCGLLFLPACIHIFLGHDVTNKLDSADNQHMVNLLEFVQDKVPRQYYVTPSSTTPPSTTTNDPNRICPLIPQSLGMFIYVYLCLCPSLTVKNVVPNVAECKKHLKFAPIPHR